MTALASFTPETRHNSLADRRVLHHTTKKRVQCTRQRRSRALISGGQLGRPLATRALLWGALHAFRDHMGSQSAAPRRVSQPREPSPPVPRKNPSRSTASLLHSQRSHRPPRRKREQRLRAWVRHPSALPTSVVRSHAVGSLGARRRSAYECGGHVAQLCRLRTLRQAREALTEWGRAARFRR
jgi:hypothetical protein